MFPTSQPLDVTTGSYTKTIWVRLNSPSTGFSWLMNRGKTSPPPPPLLRDVARPAGAVAPFATHHWRFLGDGYLRAYNLPKDFKEVHPKMGGVPENSVWPKLARDPRSTVECGNDWHHYAVAYDHVARTHTIWSDGKRVIDAFPEALSGETGTLLGNLDIGCIGGAWYKQQNGCSPSMLLKGMRVCTRGFFRTLRSRRSSTLRE